MSHGFLFSLYIPSIRHDLAKICKNHAKMVALCHNKDLWSLGVIVAWTGGIRSKDGCLYPTSSMFKESRDIV